MKGKGKTRVIAIFDGTHLVICSRCREGKPRLIAEQIWYRIPCITRWEERRQCSG